MLHRFIRILIIHICFVIISTALLVVGTFIAENQTENMLSGILVSIFVLIPWILIIMVPIALPSAICSLLIYVIGGHFRERIALVVAILVGAAVTFISLGGSYPADMKFTFSTSWKVVFTIIYLTCWTAIRRFLPKFV